MTDARGLARGLGRGVMRSLNTGIEVGGSEADVTPPSAPASLALDGRWDRAVILQWAPATDAESGISRYIIYRNGTAIATVSA